MFFSGFYGVKPSLNTDYKWEAFLDLGEITTKFLSYTSSQEAAAELYDREAKNRFGEHAKLNFPEGS